MEDRRIRHPGYGARLAALLIAGLLALSPAAGASSSEERSRFQRAIIDYRPHLNPRYKKVERRQTKYIIVHTSELGLQTTLRVVSQGKRFPNGGSTPGGHAHYVIARNGRCYRILDQQLVADHAGISMWNGDTDLSRMSIGIELVGYHYDDITAEQYRSIGNLIAILRGIYGLDERAVLTHSQVAYGYPNRWFRKDHRGRKRCAKNFERARAGLGPSWGYDPDVRSGRLMADAQLADVFYGRGAPDPRAGESNLISKVNTAWVIAGEDYDSATTVYKFPDGRVCTGDQIARQIGWDRIPVHTAVLLNQESIPAPLAEDVPVKTIMDGVTAWSLAGRLYNLGTTIYFLPSGQIKTGAMIADWDDLPVRTRLIIGYRGPYALSKERSAFRIAGHDYKSRDTIYYLPSRQLRCGHEIEDFSRLQVGTLIFLPSRL